MQTVTTQNARWEEPWVDRLGVALQTVAGLGLLVALVLAPWMYGSTRHWAIIRLCEMLSATTIVWFVALLVQWRRPRIPSPVLWATVFLFFAGWLVVLTGPVLPLDAFTENHLRDLKARFPASFVIRTPVESMWLFSGLFGALFVTVDLAAVRRWWSAIHMVMAVAGSSVVLLGLVQVLADAPAILWESDAASTTSFFATFFHYTVAGGFINLIWPLAAGRLLFHSMQLGLGRHVSAPAALFWGAAFLIGLCGLAIQLSRFAQFNALILLIVAVGWSVRRVKKPVRRRLVLGLLVVSLLFCLVIGATVLRLGRAVQISDRWQMLLVKRPLATSDYTGDFRMRPDSFIAATQQGGFFGAREIAARTCLRMIPSAGLLGFGPGSWSATYPHFTDDPMLRTFFLHVQFGHMDWLQTVVEWGILGALAWGILIAGGLWQALWWLHRSRLNGVRIGRRETMVSSTLIALGGLLLHAFVDFPLQIPSIQLYFIVLLGLAWRSVPVLMVQGRIRSADRAPGEVAEAV